MTGSDAPAPRPESDHLKGWALFVGTTVAVATATALVAWRVRRARSGPRLADVPDIIADCFDRIKQIEGDLRRLRPGAESAH